MNKILQSLAELLDYFLGGLLRDYYLVGDRSCKKQPLHATGRAARTTSALDKVRERYNLESPYQLKELPRINHPAFSTRLREPSSRF